MNFITILIITSLSFISIIVALVTAMNHIEQLWKRALLFISTIMSMGFLMVCTLSWLTNIQKQEPPKYEQINEPLYRKL
jgi:energy-coupling factor transporter transmembrane protein EcfT